MNAKGSTTWKMTVLNQLVLYNRWLYSLMLREIKPEINKSLY
ncbi:hypothetical protein OIU76_026499 [Salix suchowensis]|uniref:Ribosomal protein L23 n=1 Tax=Salix suchowensis TaxID=1278906 RepID=A0ABQ9AEG8_9ROSI|nr:hypothetical protein OIU78_024956 [Salix suchowensis]KAJ6333167.1 hypothetical protein OIU77_009105 [Salix suchowensis]KAJ6377537.1 hypothetical protein OIU76_026499 [Salix suchowensis]